MNAVKLKTKGGVIVEDIKVGDVHYEFEYGVGVKSQVIEAPVRDENGCWSWKSKNLKTGQEINYSFDEEFPAFHQINLYDYEAYHVNMWI